MYAAPARPIHAATPPLEPRGRDSLFAAQRSPANPTSHGIELKPVTILRDSFLPRLADLPAADAPTCTADQYRSMFRFQHFNAVQSSVLDDVLHSDINVVLAAPTGSGKTGAFELGIIRMLHTQDASAKVRRRRNGG
jgi:ATP-dependent DNA helicase HFM1/MER3